MSAYRADRLVPVAVAPNGARRTRADHAALPMSPAEIAAAAASAHEAGAAMLHLHVRDRDGRHVLDAGLYAEAIGAVRATLGERMIVQVTTEAVGRYTPEQQRAVVEAVRPEAVSLALRELCPDAEAEASFAAFLRFLARERIWPQVILYDEADVRRFLELRQRGLIPFAHPSVLYVLGRYSETGASGPSDLLPYLAAAGTELDFMVCAFGRTEAACAVAAALLGGGMRIGFENNLLLPDGRTAPDNAALVAAAVKPLAALGLAPEPADVWRQRVLAD